MRSRSIVPTLAFIAFFMVCIASYRTVGRQRNNYEIGELTAHSSQSSVTATQIVSENNKLALDQNPDFIDISASDLARNYHPNQDGANLLFSNQQVRVTGRIKSVDWNSYDFSYIILDGSNNYFLDITCLFTEDPELKISKLESGQQVTVIGRIVEQTEARLNYFGKIAPIDLIDCSLQ